MSDDDWETDPDHENSRADSRGASTAQVRHRATATADHPRTCKLHVCTSGACRGQGAHTTLVELEELVKLGDAALCSVEQYNCFGLCGRGPNVSIDWDDGSSEMVSGARTTNQSLDIIHKACGVRPAAGEPLLARLRELRHVSRLEQELAKAQEVVDVLDVSSMATRASDACQRKYDNALARVDAVLNDAPLDAHPRRLAEAVRRQVVAAKACRPASPEVEDVEVDDRDTWPDDPTRAS